MNTLTSATNTYFHFFTIKKNMKKNKSITRSIWEIRGFNTALKSSRALATLTINWEYTSKIIFPHIHRMHKISIFISYLNSDNRFNLIQNDNWIQYSFDFNKARLYIVYIFLFRVTSGLFFKITVQGHLWVIEPVKPVSRMLSHILLFCQFHFRNVCFCCFVCFTSVYRVNCDF